MLGERCQKSLRVVFPCKIASIPCARTASWTKCPLSFASWVVLTAFLAFLGMQCHFDKSKADNRLARSAVNSWEYRQFAGSSGYAKNAAL